MRISPRKIPTFPIDREVPDTQEESDWNFEYTATTIRAFEHLCIPTGHKKEEKGCAKLYGTAKGIKEEEEEKEDTRRKTSKRKEQSRNRSFAQAAARTLAR